MKRHASDTEAFERFYKDTAASIRAYILRHCSDRAAADDLFQITYIKFLGSRMAKTQMAREARAYLYRIASNAIADHGRTLQRRKRLETSAREQPAGDQRPPNPESLRLRDALRTLSKRDQQLLWLIYAEGFAHQEVAGIMNLKRASVRVLAFRARKKLARLLGAAGEISGRAS